MSAREVAAKDEQIGQRAGRDLGANALESTRSGLIRCCAFAAEMMMARRQVGQERLGVGFEKVRSTATLDDMSSLIDWVEIDRRLAGIYAGGEGESAWPPLALFRALLLATWHDLSDVKLAEASDDRASFRRFCGFAAAEPTPERTAFVRFRAELVRLALDRPLFEVITRQLEAKGVTVRTGTLVDATLIASASIRHDDGGCKSLDWTCRTMSGREQTTTVIEG